MDRIVDMVEKSSTTIADDPSGPTYIEIKEHGAASSAAAAGPISAASPTSAAKSPATPSPASPPAARPTKGGLKGGDRIIQFGSRKITGLDDFDLALRRFGAGDEVAIIALRGGKTGEAESDDGNAEIVPRHMASANGCQGSESPPIRLYCAQRASHYSGRGKAKLEIWAIRWGERSDAGLLLFPTSIRCARDMSVHRGIRTGRNMMQ